MVSKFLDDLPSPLAQFAVIQVAIFASMAVIAWVADLDFSIALTMVGAIIFIFRFVGASRRANDSDKPNHPLSFLMTATAIGLFPMVIGFVLAFI